MNKQIMRLRDGRFAICEEIKVKDGVSVIRPVDGRRFYTYSEAVIFGLGNKMPTTHEPKPKVVIDKSNYPARDQFRVTKLDKGVFVVELLKSGSWMEVRSFKTRSKADEYVATHCK